MSLKGSAACEGRCGRVRVDLLTVAEVAERLKKHPKTIYRMVWNGTLAWVNVAESGSRAQVRFRETDLCGYVDARLVAPRQRA